ncbi:MAG: glycoside hydrolase family 127 protein [Lachnospiraceae bacterium]|nr:glycoside hydrolase family 127 protein [Lachnospiraceae bacterium]
MKRLNLMDLKGIRISDPFWDKYTKLVTKEVIPYQWNAINDNIEDAEKSHCIENYKIAAKRTSGEFYGFVFQDTDLTKWLEAVAFSLSYEPNEELEKQADWAIDLIADAQQDDGYLDTYFIIKEPDAKFCNLKEGHELYSAGHMIEAAVAYYKVTGKEKFLNVAKKNADLLVKVFNEERYKTAVPGHEEIELALYKLYEVTGNRDYLELAKAFVDRRGVEPNYLALEHKNEDYVDIFKDPNPYNPLYSQSHMPVREQNSAEGHAVRAVYLYSAMADIAYEYDDKELFTACEKLYDNIVEKRMFITGGIGSSGAYERFTVDYDLPNNAAYAESCASIGLAFFCRRMLSITRDEKYADTMERALYNTVLAGIAMDGKSFFYVNPLEVWPDNLISHTSLSHVRPVRQKWFGCACCPPNIARTLASLGEYVAMVSETALFLNLYVSSELSLEWNGIPLSVNIDSKMPGVGDVTIKIKAEKEVSGDIWLRIPAYAKAPVLYVNNIETAILPDKGYTKVHIENEKDVEIGFRFEMQPHFVFANTNVREDEGKACIVMGPLVYCMEEVDNGKNLAGVYLDTEAPINVSFEEDLLGGTTVLYASGERYELMDKEGPLYFMQKPKRTKDTFKFIPYCYWDNRETGEMSVWLKTL